MHVRTLIWSESLQHHLVRLHVLRDRVWSGRWRATRPLTDLRGHPVCGPLWLISVDSGRLRRRIQPALRR